MLIINKFNNLITMLLFDIGALLFLTGLICIIRFLIKRNNSALIPSVIISLIGGLVMFVAYYIVAGNQSVFDKLIS